MTTQYENRGVLFRNKNKQGNQPDYKGKLTLNGEEDQLSAWIKLDKNGQEFLSISRTPASEAAKYSAPSNQNEQAPRKLDQSTQGADNIGF